MSTLVIYLFISQGWLHLVEHLFQNRYEAFIDRYHKLDKPLFLWTTRILPLGMNFEFEEIKGFKVSYSLLSGRKASHFTG